jgi:hypothetical protein
MAAPRATGRGQKTALAIEPAGAATDLFAFGCGLDLRI